MNRYIFKSKIKRTLKVVGFQFLIRYREDLGIFMMILLRKRNMTFDFLQQEQVSPSVGASSVA